MGEKANILRFLLQFSAVSLIHYSSCYRSSVAWREPLISLQVEKVGGCCRATWAPCLDTFTLAGRLGLEKL